MIVYLLKNYLVISVLVSMFLMANFLLAGVQDFHLKAFFWGGIVGCYLTNLLFKKRNLWVLYHNLQLPQHLLLAAMVVAFEIISISSIMVVLNP